MQFAHDVLEWLKSWPVPVWTTIGGSAMTLVGVLFSDWRNTKRMRIQNEFSASQNERARIMAVKKEVYLTAAGAIAKAQVTLVSLPHAEVESADGPATEFSELVGKVSMIGDTDTVLLAQKLAADYADAQTELALMASDVSSAQSRAKMYEEYRNKALAHVDRIYAEVARFLESGSMDKVQFEALQRSQARFQKEAQDHWAKENAALGEVARLTNSYLRKTLALMTPLGDTSTELLIAIRRELGQDTDAARLSKAIVDNRDRAFQKLRELIEFADAEREQLAADTRNHANP